MQMPGSCLVIPSGAELRTPHLSGHCLDSGASGLTCTFRRFPLRTWRELWTWNSTIIRTYTYHPLWALPGEWRLSTVQFSSVSQSCPTLCDPMNCSMEASRSWLKLISLESAMPSNHLVLYCPLLLLPLIFPSIRVFSNESALGNKWPKYTTFKTFCCINV